jgi:hypothetical protein
MEFCRRRVGLPFYKRCKSQRQMGRRVAVIKFGSTGCMGLGELQLLLSHAGADITRRQYRESELAVRWRIFGVALRSLLQQVDCRRDLIFGQAPEKRISPDHHIPSVEIFWQATLRADSLSFQKLGLNCADNLLCYFVLQREYVA